MRDKTLKIFDTLIKESEASIQYVINDSDKQQMREFINDFNKLKASYQDQIVLINSIRSKAKLLLLKHKRTIHALRVNYRRLKL